MSGLKCAVWAVCFVLAMASPVRAQTVSIQLMHNSQEGAYLADGQGRAFYLFTKDGPNVSTCFKRCRAFFEPVWGTAVEGQSSIDLKRFGSFRHVKGDAQLTYGGYPVYYAVEDKAPGDIKGQRRDQSWFLIVPENMKDMPKKR